MPTDESEAEIVALHLFLKMFGFISEVLFLLKWVQVFPITSTDTALSLRSEGLSML